LEPWTDERASSRDYRILYLDVAAAHLGKDVEEYCWAKGYVYLLHYGGTTGICQVNDTHCHLQLSQFYLEREQAFFTEIQKYDPGNVNRTLDQVVADVVTTWRSIDHLKGYIGHWETGLANKLNGDEDKFITGEARQVWDHLVMHPMRQVAFTEVDKMIADGDVTSFADVRKVIKHPPTNGEYRAGEEFEGSLLPGEKLWETDADIALFAEDDKTEFDNPLTCTTALVAYETGDDIPEWQEGNLLAKRLARLRRVRQEAQALHLRPAVFQINRDITNLERGRLKKNTTKSKLNAVFLRSLRVDQGKAKLYRLRVIARHAVYERRKHEHGARRQD
jgi:hypothetical protein